MGGLALALGGCLICQFPTVTSGRAEVWFRSTQSLYLFCVELIVGVGMLLLPVVLVLSVSPMRQYEQWVMVALVSPVAVGHENCPFDCLL